jgi:O-6-methylguanine DNA methyltransferase
MSINQQILTYLQHIPHGKVVSYSYLAHMFKTSPRAVARIMSSNKHPDIFPCYKVVRKDGSLAGYSCEGGITRKKQLLHAEGIKFSGDKIDPEYILQVYK